MFTHIVGQSAHSNSLNINGSQQLQGDVEATVSQEIALSAVNVEILVAVDVSALKSIVMLSTNNCTVKTNDDTTPDDTINLVANRPYVWTVGDYNANLVTADVSKIFVTNGAATVMTFQMLALTDSP